MFGSYQVGPNAKAQLESCDAEVDFSLECSSTNSFAPAFFFIGNILIGVGAAPLFTVAFAYLDDIVKPKHVPIHIAIAYSLAIVGPALGFGLGGVFLDIYVDPWRETNLEPTDPGWVGAWWMCFIFSGVISWILAIPFLLFPRLLPDSHEVKKERQLEMAKKYKGKYKANEDVDFITKVKLFPHDIKQVVTTLSWVFISACVCCSFIVISGVAAFAPKYVESQFTLTTSTASLVIGSVGEKIISSTHLFTFFFSVAMTLHITSLIIIIILCNPITVSHIY